MGHELSRQTAHNLIFAVANCVWLSAAAAQAVDDPGLDLVVVYTDGQADPCITEAGLAARIVSYARRGSTQAAHALGRVETRAGEATFTLLEGDRVVARRHFAALPTKCDDRRDTIALAILVANESRSERRQAAATTRPRSRSARTIRSSEPRLDVHADAEREAEKAAARDAPAPAADEAEATRDPQAIAAGRPEETAAEREAAEVAAARIRDATRDAKAKAARDAREEAAAAEAHAAEEREDAAQEASDTQRDEAEDASAPHAAASDYATTNMLRAGARYIWRALPINTLVLTAGGELATSRRTSVVVSALIGLPANKRVEGGELRNQLFGGEGLGCIGVPLFGPMAGRACGGLSGGAVAVAGTGFDRNGSATLLWLAGVARVGLMVASDGPLALQVHIDGYLNALRNELQTIGIANQTSAGRVGLAVGLELSLDL
ncbi:MAG TPA: hypothetical protein VFN67_40665 [Polyangiales bacterium]|nr:hypothetical protein [Polyangiales bacterium]